MMKILEQSLKKEWGVSVSKFSMFFHLLIPWLGKKDAIGLSKNPVRKNPFFNFPFKKNRGMGKQIQIERTSKRQIKIQLILEELRVLLGNEGNVINQRRLRFFFFIQERSTNSNFLFLEFLACL